MPNIVPTARYYPKLSEVITVDDLPEFLSFVENGLNAIFDKIHYKNLQFSKSYRGDSAFYSLDIVSSTKLAIPLPFDLALVLNPDLTGGDSTISSFPITLEYQWEILAFLKSFNLDNFSFSLEEFYNIGLQVFRISDDQVLSHILNNFVEPANDNTTTFQQFISDINGALNLQPTLELPENPDLKTVMELVKNHPDIDGPFSNVLFSSYILDTDLDQTKVKLQGFFNIVVPDGIENYIKKLITPKAKATLALSAGIEFPPNILKPVTETGVEIPDTKTLFVFAQAQLYADTEEGIGYQFELAGSLLPEYAAIGKTGLILQINSLKLDLSRKKNIIEADLDGRPSDFVGVYARAISVTLPSKWFNEDTTPNNASATLRIGAYDLLVGTGGLSGTIMLETVPQIASGGTYEYFNDVFAFEYPIQMPKKNTTTGIIENKKINNYSELKTYLQVLNNSNTPHSFVFPLYLTTTSNVSTPVVPNKTYSFNNIQEYQLFLKTITSDDTILWKKIGGDNGFRIGFSAFDITFKQNKVLQSNIRAALEIKKFVHPDTGLPVQILVEGHLHDDGDFNLTASTNPAFPLRLPNVFTYEVSTLELGKDDEKFYIGTSGKIKFEGFIENTLKLGAIDINRLRIYSDGTIELQGGSIQLAEPIILPLGPVNITVTAIHYGSHQKEVNGVMRKFNYFGFDGGMSVDPLGIEIRGDGVKLYYCSDNLPDPPSPFLHIKTLYIDITVPASSPAATINGWLSIPEPGVSPEYAGGITLKVPSLKLAGKADMRLAPKYPAFIIDAEIEPPTAIPLGSFAIFGFRGLLGYRYVAEKEAIGLVSGVNTWFEYYKAPEVGINVHKFSGPEKTKGYKTPISIGLGATLGTSYDDGYTMSIKAMVLLSMPSLFMIDGKAAILSKRLGLDNAGDPPFFAFIAIGDNSVELGFGADYKLPKGSGSMLSLYAEVQAGFFFNNSSNWYVNIGTKTKPVTARVLSLITLKSYLMLSARGIEAGARGEFIFNKTYGPVKVAAWAYIEVGGKISFEKPQIGGYIAAGVGAEINIRILHLYVSLDILFGSESPKPFLIYGKFRLCVKVKILFIKIKFCGNVEISWNFNNEVDRAPINPLISNASASTLELQEKISQLVKGVNMLSNETFELAYLQTAPSANTLPDSFTKKIIPLDTYIDIKFEKGLIPTNVAGKIGGVNTPPQKYTDLIPPDAVVKGKTVRQVKHQYKIDSIELKYWDNGQWKDYHPYKALYPDDNTGQLNNLKIGQWQKIDGQYNAIRLLATTPFSYTEQGEPGWFTPEQSGFTAGSMFCEGENIVPKCADFLNKPLDQRYYCYDVDNSFFYSNDVAFMLLNSADDEFAYISDETNLHEVSQSLSFNNSNQLQILLPEASAEIDLKLTSFAGQVKITYYSTLIDDTAFEVQFGHPDNSITSNEGYEVIVNSADYYTTPISFRLSDFNNWRPISKIIIEPILPNVNLINQLTEEIAQINENNYQIFLGNTTGSFASTEQLETELATLKAQGCLEVPLNTNPQNFVCTKDVHICNLKEIINYEYEQKLPENDNNQAGSTVPAIRDIFGFIDTFNSQYPNYSFWGNIVETLDSLYYYGYEFNGIITPAVHKTIRILVAKIIFYLNEIGNCDCNEPTITKCYTLLHEVCWLSLEHYEYNINIPSQEAISEDSFATAASVTQFIQPIWRPDTHYYVTFKLIDIVDNSNATTYPFTYGFSTGGPIGFFHKHDHANYVASEENADKYPLTSLTQYIDYKRSYPNADGNLLSAKPLFYDDPDFTKISLFFTKPYATHFFQEWQEYGNLSNIKGQMKIVIKDPREDISIANPPSLDTIDETLSIPQTIEEWTQDYNPNIPLVLSQWMNLFNANNCIIDKPELITPASEYMVIRSKKLKPQKLYTAIVNNIYDLNKDGNLGPHVPNTDTEQPNKLFSDEEETTEVHRFVFQTSRYRNFSEQVNSYQIVDEMDNNIIKDAIFSLSKPLETNYIQAMYNTILGTSISNLFSPEIEQRLLNNYQHPFDRVIEGILGFNPLNQPISNEFNLIRNSITNEVIAIWIRNPEPFNNPKMSIEEVSDTIQVVKSNPIIFFPIELGRFRPPPIQWIVDNSYKILHSKDYSQCLIMCNQLLIEKNPTIRFRYKYWDGTQYTFNQFYGNSEVRVGNIDINIQN
jgi:hypothetical protein